MPKLQRICPFSRKTCIECGIFRGRHLALCKYPQYQEHHWNRKDVIARRPAIDKPISAKGGFRFEFPELPEKPAWPANLEDCIERRNG
jgi:hypothetical protein